MKPITYRGAIFDLDGTLVDSMWIWETVIVRWLNRCGLACEEDLTPIIKDMTFEQSAQYIIGRFGLEKSVGAITAEWSAMILDDYRYHIQLKEGVFSFVRALHAAGVKMCIATSNFRDACTAVLESGGIADCFEFILISDEIGKNKSFPDIYLESARRLGLAPADCMVFEDILLAVGTAKNAGFQTTAVYDKESVGETERLRQTADQYITSFQELL